MRFGQLIYTGRAVADVCKGFTTCLSTRFPRVRRTARSGLAVAQRNQYLLSAQIRPQSICRHSTSILDHRYHCRATDRNHSGQAGSCRQASSPVSALHRLRGSSNESPSPSKTLRSACARSRGCSMLGHDRNRMDLSFRYAGEGQLGERGLTALPIL